MHLLFDSPADLYLRMLAVVSLGVLGGVALDRLVLWLFGPPNPRRTGVRRSRTVPASGRARVPHTGATCPDLHNRTTTDLLASADRARREVVR